MSEISHKTLRASIETELGLKVKFTSVEQAYDLLKLLKALLPAAEEPKAPAPAKAEKPKKVKKATTVTADEAELLAPADADATGGDAPVLGATDPFRGNKYRVQSLAAGLCVGRRYDEKNPIVGTRTCDAGANGILYPELQCTKKPVAGGRLCTTCLAREAEFLGNPSKPPKLWYGRLDEPLYEKTRIVGSKWFLDNYPAGIADAPVTAPAAAAEPKKSKKPKAAVVAEVVEEMEAPKKSKKGKAAAAPPAEEAPEAAEEAESEPEVVAVAPPKKAKKDKAPKAEEAPAPAAEAAPAPAPKPKKASVASSSSAKDVEWVTFIADGVVLIRHSKTGNVYQCDRSKHRLEDMVQRDKYEGKWRDGRLDPYADEEDD